MIHSMDENSYSDMEEILISMLEQGRIKGELVDVGDLRNIGKSTSLKKYADSHGYIALLGNFPFDMTMNLIRNDENKDKKIIIDECVDFGKLPDDIQRRVITGFYNRKMGTFIKEELWTKYKVGDKDFNSEIVNNLKDEEKSLRGILNKCKVESNFAMYKNLINCYERVVELIKLYDYKFMYSEYTTENGKQVAIWEQNRDGIIRNHKVWDVK